MGAYSDMTMAMSLPLFPLPFLPYILTGGMATPPATRQYGGMSGDVKPTTGSISSWETM